MVAAAPSVRRCCFDPSLPRTDGGLTDAQISECFAEIADDPGPLDLGRLLDQPERKVAVQNRSKDEERP